MASLIDEVDSYVQFNNFSMKNSINVSITRLFLDIEYDQLVVKTKDMAKHYPKLNNVLVKMSELRTESTNKLKELFRKIVVIRSGLLRRFHSFQIDPIIGARWKLKTDELKEKQLTPTQENILIDIFQIEKSVQIQIANYDLDYKRDFGLFSEYIDIFIDICCEIKDSLEGGLKTNPFKKTTDPVLYETFDDFKRQTISVYEHLFSICN
ncbi:hypothetical protein [Carp edema virus]|nr:hypothetical protein [Carp edema virus]